MTTTNRFQRRRYEREIRRRLKHEPEQLAVMLALIKMANADGQVEIGDIDGDPWVRTPECRR